MVIFHAGEQYLGGKTMRRTKRRVPRIGIACLSLLIFTATLWSQSATGRILGKITDPTGAVVPGVKVTATNTATGVNSDTLTNEVGDYQILALPIGEYKVTAELPGFQTAISKPETL